MEAPRGVEPTGTNGRTRHTFRFPCLGVGSRPVVVSRWMARNAVSCGHETKDRSVLLASVVRFPDRHDRNRSCGWFRCCRPPVLPVGRCIGFAVVMAQVRRPVPFRTRKLRPGRGDGTALERVWESSTPPHSTSGFPSSVTLREPPFLFVFRFPGDPRARRSGNPFFVCLLVRVSRGAREAPNPQHPCIAWSVSVTVSNDVMRLTRYARAGSRESRYDGKRQKPDN